MPPPPAHPPAVVRFLPPPQPSLCHHKPLTPTPVSATPLGGRGARWVALGKPEICQGSDSSRFQTPTTVLTTFPLHPPFSSISCHSMLLSASHLLQLHMLGTLFLAFPHPLLTGVLFCWDPKVGWGERHAMTSSHHASPHFSYWHGMKRKQQWQTSGREAGGTEDQERRLTPHHFLLTISKAGGAEGWDALCMLHLLLSAPPAQRFCSDLPCLSRGGFVWTGFV